MAGDVRSRQRDPPIASGIVLASCGVALASHFAPKAQRACETRCAQMDKCCTRASAGLTPAQVSAALKMAQRVQHRAGEITAEKTNDALDELAAVHGTAVNA